MTAGGPLHLECQSKPPAIYETWKPIRHLHGVHNELGEEVALGANNLGGHGGFGAVDQRVLPQLVCAYRQVLINKLACLLARGSCAQAKHTMLVNMPLRIAWGGDVLLSKNTKSAAISTLQYSLCKRTLEINDK